MFKISLLFVFSALVAGAAACTPASGQLQVQDVWARPALAGGNSAAYFTIENGTTSNDTLLSVSSDVAGAAELHMTLMQDGNMQMAQQQKVPAPAGKTDFKPGGLHVMLIGLKRDLNPGDTFSLTLDFATAGKVPLNVKVREP